MPKTRKREKLEEKKHTRVDWSRFPPELIIHTLSFLSFDEIAQCRQVCRSFNVHGKYLLNKEAKRVLNGLRTDYENLYDDLYEKIPRIPQSFTKEGRLQWGPIWGHVLRREWRYVFNCFSKLYNTYEAYMHDDTCFVAGKVLDCTNAITSLGYFKSPERRVQLYDLIPQACYHFRGVIIPLLRKRSLRPLPARAVLSTLRATTTTAATGSTRKLGKRCAGKKRRPILSRKGARPIRKLQICTHVGVGERISFEIRLM